MAKKVKTAVKKLTQKLSPNTFPLDYSEIVIQGNRKSSKVIEVSVQSSPLGGMEAPVSIYFSENDGRNIRNSFYSGFNRNSHGRAQITQSEATELGKQLSKVLFPPTIFEYFSKSLSKVVQTSQSGLR